MVEYYANKNAAFFWALNHSEKGYSYLFWWDANGAYKVDKYSVSRVSKEFPLSRFWYRIGI